MSHIIVQRVFGRTSDEEKLIRFSHWFVDNLEKLEEPIDEDNPYNGTMSIDFQEKTDSFVVEIKTAVNEFAEEIKNKFEELEFTDWAMVGDVRKG